MGEAQADLQALDGLRPVLERLQLQIEDTTNALDSDAMATRGIGV